MARGGEQGFCCERIAEYKLEIDVLFAKCLPPFKNSPIALSALADQIKFAEN